MLLDTWEEALEIATDTETKARINGVSSQMKSFEFLFGAVLGENILRHTDYLSKTLQSKAMSGAEGQEVAAMVVRTLESMRDDTSFDLFWSKTTTLAENYSISEPQIPRPRKRPKRYEHGLTEGETHTDAIFVSNTLKQLILL